MTWWGYALAAVISAAAVLWSQSLGSKREDRRSEAEREAKRLDRLYQDRRSGLNEVLNLWDEGGLVEYGKPGEAERLSAAGVQLTNLGNRLEMIADSFDIVVHAHAMAQSMLRYSHQVNALAQSGFTPQFEQDRTDAWLAGSNARTQFVKAARFELGTVSMPITESDQPTVSARPDHPGRRRPGSPGEP